MRAASARKRRKRKPQDPTPRPPAAARTDASNRIAAHMPPQHRLGNIAVSGKAQTGGSGTNHGQAISMEGRTDYTFADADYVMPNTALQQGSDCDGCEGRDCVSITAPVTITYSVSTSVTLPSASDYPDLSECEARNVQNAIDTVLAPHEQEHVDAVTPYNGSETVTFSGTYCRSDVAQAVDDMVEAREATRQSAARARSDALDPFNFTIDPSEGCEAPEPEPEAPTPEPPAETPSQEDKAPPQDTPEEPTPDGPAPDDTAPETPSTAPEAPAPEAKP